MNLPIFFLEEKLFPQQPPIILKQINVITGRWGCTN